MAGLSTGQTFLEHLQASRLLGDEQLTALQTDGLSSEQIARELVRRQWLTPWQAQRLLAGQRAFFLGKYKLMSLLGQGGMGAVFKAEQRPLGRIVALKVMAEKLVRDPLAVARFHREIQSAAALSHPNIVRAFDADCVGQTHFLVMEYVDGKSLDDLIKERGRLPVGEACEYMRQAAVGLQHACELGLVHRDIKPGNLLLVETEQGPVVKILDMGLARLNREAEDQTELTQTGQVMGTPDYIAPEQAQNTKLADIRADIFSLGCTLFKLLTGGLPFGGTTLMEKLMARGLQDAARVRSQRAEVSKELDAVVARMLARRPADRFQTPQEVVDALTPHCSLGKPSSIPENSRESGATQELEAISLEAIPLAAGVEAELNRFFKQLSTDSSVSVPSNGLPASGVETQELRKAQTSSSPLSRRVARSRVSQRLRVIGTVAGGITVVAVAALLLLLAREPTSTLVLDWPEEDRAGAKLEVDGHVAPVTSADPLRLVGRAGRRTLKISREGFVPIEQEWTLKSGGEQTYRPEWKRTASAQVRDQLAGLRRDVEAALGDAPKTATFNAPESIARVRKQLVEFRKSQKVELLTDVDALLARLPAPADGLRRESISPRELAILGGGKESDAPQEVVGLIGDTLWRGAGGGGPIACSRDGQWIAAGDKSGIVRVWNSQTGEQKHAFPGPGHVTSGVAFTADSKHLIASSYHAGIREWDLASGDTVRDYFVPIEAGYNVSLAISPDGTTLAVGRSMGKIVTWNVANGEVLKVFQHVPLDIVALAFTIDSRRIVAGVVDGIGGKSPKSTLGLWSIDREEPLWTANPGSVRSLAMTPDGRRAVVSDLDSLIVWDLDANKELTRQPTSGLTSLTFDRTGKRMAAVGADVQIVDTETWTVVQHGLILPQGGHVTFTADDTSIVASTPSPRLEFFDVKSSQTRPTGVVCTCAAIAPDSQSVWVGTTHGELIAFDLSTLKEIRRLPSRTSRIVKLAIDRSGTLLAVGTWNDVSVLKLDSGEQLQLLRPTDTLMDMTFSPDGQQLACGFFSGFLRIWDPKTGKLLKELDGNRETRMEFFSIDFSRDGQRIATGSWDNAQCLRVWDLSSGLPKPLSRSSEGHAYSVQFSPDGRYVIAGSANGSVRIWEPEQSEAGMLLETQDSPVIALAWVDPGKTILAGGANGAVSHVTVPAGDVLKRFNLGSLILQLVPTPEGRHVLALLGNGTAAVLRMNASQRQ